MFWVSREKHQRWRLAIVAFKKAHLWQKRAGQSRKRACMSARMQGRLLRPIYTSVEKTVVEFIHLLIFLCTPCFNKQLWVSLFCLHNVWQLGNAFCSLSFFFVLFFFCFYKLFIGINAFLIICPYLALLIRKFLWMNCL